MNVIIKHIELIERIDQLVRLQATGNSAELAERLNISRAQLYRIIDVMKELKAPIEYNFTMSSYIYTEQGNFRFGFFCKEDILSK
ncbi:MAG: HTH domain-containing protein [Bacteroidota bacterium]